MREYINLVLGALILGGCISAAQLPPLIAARRTRCWRRTTGVVLERDLVGVHYGPDLMPGLRPVVRYRYPVEGREYVSSRVNVTGFSRSAAEAAYDRYGPGMHVEVWYDPAAPDQAVLKPGAPLGAYLWAGFGVALLAFSVVASQFFI